MKIIPIANQKGGVDKTTITMQLAAILSRRFRVLVVDVDPQQSTVWWAENARDRLPFHFAGRQSPRMLAHVRELKVDYDFVLVDTPGSLEDTPTLETVLDAADYVVVPLTPAPLAAHHGMSVEQFARDQPRPVSQEPVRSAQRVAGELSI